MNDIPFNEDDTTQQELERLLKDPALRDNPLLPIVSQLYQKNRQQEQRLDKLLKIADGFDSLIKGDQQTLYKRYERHIKRLEKIAHISDLYQKDIIQLNEQLQHISTHDPLTDLPNRRYLMTRIKQLTALANRQGRRYSVMLLDLDYFKLFNDYYGHETGDQVLCEMAQLLTARLRTFDICGRWGGEEFLLLLPDVILPEAAEIGKRMLAHVQSRDWHYGKSLALASQTDQPQPASLSFSAGIATYQLGESFEETIRRADNAMYQAKNQGRACVVSAA
ncbi:MAG: diguanylate cyclase [Methylococcales bacterium]|nr:diguanylate cyclase [Methylococcales bacterium]